MQFEPLVIRASAGSGKTFALASRYLALLVAGEEPERILATTFTRKAAGEILQRIFMRLAIASQSEQGAHELSQMLGITTHSLTQSDVQRLLLRLVTNQHRLSICTLDSLFMRMARGFELDLGLPIGWLIADTGENRLLIEEALGELCREQNGVDLLSLLSQLRGGKARRSVHQTLDTQIEQMYGLFRAADESAWEWMADFEDLNAQQLGDDGERILEDHERREIFESLADPDLPLTKTGSPNKNWQKGIVSFRRALQNTEWEELLTSGPGRAVFDKSERYHGLPFPPSLITLVRPIVEHAKLQILGQIAKQLRAGESLLRAFDKRLEKLRQQRGGYAFDDLKRVLASRALQGDLTELYFRLDVRFAHLLLDEFQDTSGLEWKVLEPVVEEILSKAQGEHSFFCVGDVKQAIYGWRGGVAEIFDAIEGRWDHLRVIAKDRSYRCSQPVIDIVNSVFGMIATNDALRDYSDAACRWGARFCEHTVERSDAPGYVSFRSLSIAVEKNGTEDDVLDPYVPFRQAAALCKELLQRNSTLQIGVLVRRNRSVARMMYELSRPGVEVAASEEGGSSLVDSPAVTIILSLLTLVDHPADTIARFHVARSPLGEALHITPGGDSRTYDEALQGIQKRVLCEGLGAVVAWLVRELSPFCAPRDRERLRQLAELAFAYRGAPLTRLHRFVSAVTQSRVENPGSANVRVMTIHQSKGLEFDAVILPELDLPLARDHGDFLRWYDDPIEGPVRVSPPVRRELRPLHPEFERMHHQGTSERVKEALSLLYVALTRARNALYMVSADQVVSPSFAGILRAALVSEGEQHHFSHGDERWWEKLANVKSVSDSIAAATADADEVSIVFAPEASQRLGRGVITPSSLEGALVAGHGAQLRARSVSGQRFGTLIHRLFEQVSWLENFNLGRSELLCALEALEGLNQEKERAVDFFLRALRYEGVRESLSRRRFGASSDVALYREQPFAMRYHDAVLRGAFDRLVQWGPPDTPSGVELVDFKTDFFPSERFPDKDALLDYYRPQIEAYRHAASMFCGFPLQSVCVKLVLVSNGEVLEVVQ